MKNKQHHLTFFVCQYCLDENKKTSELLYKCIKNLYHIVVGILFFEKTRIKLPNMVIIIIFAVEKRIPLLYENNI